MADLAGIREQVLEFSGRLDLDQDDSNSIKKVHHAINSGQRWLDARVPTSKNSLRRVVAIVADDISADVRYLRAIERVWISGPSDGTGTEQRTELCEADIHKLRAIYQESDSSNIDTGRPIEFAIDTIGLSPEQKAVTDLSAFDDVETISTGEHWNVDTLLFYPPADQAYTMNIYGIFWSLPLTGDTDVSHWTIRHPEMLVHASLMVIEARLRNRQGVNDYLAFLETELTNIDKDLARRDVSHDRMTMFG